MAQPKLTPEPDWSPNVKLQPVGGATDGESWVKLTVDRQLREGLKAQMAELHPKMIQGLPSLSESVQDIVTARVQATVLAEHYLDEAARSRGSVDSARGKELVRLAIHLRERAVRFAEAAVKMANQEIAWAREQQALGDGGRSIFARQVVEVVQGDTREGPPGGDAAGPPEGSK